MKKWLVLAMLFAAIPAAAQQAQAPNDSQILGARSTMFEAEARYFAAWSQRLTSDLAAEQAARKAEQEYWKAYVDGLRPETKAGGAH